MVLYFASSSLLRSKDGNQTFVQIWKKMIIWWNLISIIIYGVAMILHSVIDDESYDLDFAQYIVIIDLVQFIFFWIGIGLSNIIKK